MNQYPNQNQNPPTQPPYSPYPQYSPYQGTVPPQGVIPPRPMDPKMAEKLRYEAYCKQRRKKEIGELILKGLIIGGAILGMFIIEMIVVLLVLRQPKYEALYDSSSLFQNCFNVIAVHVLGMGIPFSLAALILKKKSVPPLIPTKKIGKAKMCAWVGLGMGLCVLSNFLTDGVIKLYELAGYELSQPELLEADSPFACIALIFSTAVVPAIFEEYAMRCCSLSALRKHGKAFGVVVVSILFGLIHGNMIQLAFAFCVGLVLGYITVVTDNVIPAMLIHGLNNGISVTYEILCYTSGEKIADTATDVLFYVWVAVSLISLAYLIWKKELIKKEPKKPRQPYELAFGTKLLCLVPGLLLPTIILIVETNQYIQPIQ